MFRTQILKGFTQKPLFDNIILKNTSFIYYNRCQCMLSTSFSDRNTVPIHRKIKDENVNSGDRKFLVKLKLDPDTFGQAQQEETVDEGDLQEEKYFTEQPLPSKKLSTKQYADIIKDLIKQRKIKEAIDIVEVRMLKEDRVQPENYIYNLLLGACGRVGYTKKAFKLYNDMKRRGLAITGGTYTALFNACANSPWPLDGLERATHLREIMIEKGYEPNDTNYNAMIKAFGRCGYINTAFALADEMFIKGIAVKDDTINFLLQACISDKEVGFRHALLVWRKLIEKNIKPSLYTYNLMLRSIRDCSLGDMEVTQDVINRLVGNAGNKSIDLQEKQLLISTESKGIPGDLNISNNIVPDNCSDTLDVTAVPDSNTSDTVKDNHDHKQVASVKTKVDCIEIDLITSETNLSNLRPNLMATLPHLGNIVSLSQVTKPEDRLLLVGGFRSFLDNMKEHNCMPDIKTFTLLLDSIPSTLAAEMELISAMKSFKVKPDIDFYNMLIKKRSMRFEYESAKEVLNMMKVRGYRPNIVTYGVLALSCKTKDECSELVNTMIEGNYRLNAEILGAMLNQACYHMNFGYVLKVMELCLSNDVNPNKKFMEVLADFKSKCKNLSNLQKLSKAQDKGFQIFKARYKTWLQEVEVDQSEDAHPWQQYRQNTDGENKYTWKDSVKFKPRRKSLFKVKTSPKHMHKN